MSGSFMSGGLLRAKAIIIPSHMCLALLVSAVLACSASAQDRGSLVGAWYGELAVSESRLGRPINFRRWLRTLRGDGTYTIVFRYYFDNRLQVESIQRGVWGQQGRLYWTECRSRTENGRPAACLHRPEYTIHRVDAREMAYTDRATGRFFVVTRVPTDFRLP